jgi:aspartate kinase
MANSIVVAKFGGTSVTGQARQHAAARIAALKAEGHKVVAVISAMRAKAQKEIFSTDYLIDLAEDIGPEANLRSKDLLLSCGEIVSTVLMSHYMSTHYPWRTIPLAGGQAGIVTDFKYGDASITAIYPEYILRLLEEDTIVFVAGFQGITDTAESDSGYHGAITTLGRGGSDTTACALGHALNADRVDIFTDVPGVMTADPDFFRDLPDDQKPFAHRLVTYADVCEMAHLGAKVVQARAAEIAMQHKVRLRVASTTEECEGTIITTAEETKRPLAITSIANSEIVFHIEFSLDEARDKKQIEQEVLRLLGEAEVSVYFVNSTPRSTSFVVSGSSLEAVRELLYGVVIPIPYFLASGAPSPAQAEVPKMRYYVIGPPPSSVPRWTGKTNVQRQCEILRAGAPGSEVVELEVSVGTPCRIVSIIGPDLKEVPGVLYQVTETLEERGIEILEIAESKNSLSCLIDEGDLAPAVQALHQKLIIEAKGVLKP